MHHAGAKLFPRNFVPLRALILVGADAVAVAMQCKELDFDIKTVSSELEGTKAQNLADGITRGWLAAGTETTASVEVTFSYEVRLHSVMFVGVGISRISISLVGNASERGSYTGQAAMSGSFDQRGNIVLVYEGALPGGPDDKCTLGVGLTGNKMKPVTSQQPWIGVRIRVSQAASARGRPFGLKKLEINRHLIEQEAASCKAAASALENTTARNAPPSSFATPASSAPSATTAFSALPSLSGSFDPGFAAPRAAPAPAPAASSMAPTARAPVPRPGAAPSLTIGARVCQCGKPGCRGCGPPCKAHRQRSVLMVSKTSKNNGRPFYMCPVGPNAVPRSCGWQAWCDEAVGLIATGGAPGPASAAGAAGRAAAQVELPDDDESDGDGEGLGGFSFANRKGREGAAPAGGMPQPSPARPSPAAAPPTSAAAAPATPSAAPPATSSAADHAGKTEAQALGGAARSALEAAPLSIGLPVKEMKRRILAAGLDPEGVVEREELFAMAKRAEAMGRPPVAAGPSRTDRGGGGGGGGGGESGSALEQMLAIGKAREAKARAQSESRKAAKYAAGPAAPAAAAAATAHSVVRDASTDPPDGSNAWRKRKTPVSLDTLEGSSSAPLRPLRAASAEPRPGVQAGVGVEDVIGDTTEDDEEGDSSPARVAAIESGYDDSTTEDDETEGAAGAGGGAKVLWPPRTPPCKYGSACTRVNPKHFSGGGAEPAYAHPATHVRKVLAKLDWTGPRGALYRVLSAHGLRQEAEKCATRAEMLGVLDEQIAALSRAADKKRRLGAMQREQQEQKKQRRRGAPAPAPAPADVDKAIFVD